MKLLLRAVLINIAVLLVISSWATITEGQQPYFNWQFGDEPSSRDELKLTSMEIPQSWDLSTNMEYWATIKFETDLRIMSQNPPQIEQALKVLPLRPQNHWLGDEESNLDSRSQSPASYH